MDESSKLLLTVAIPTVTVLVGILVNNRQLDSLERRFSSEIGGVRGEMNSLRAEMNSLRAEMNSLRAEMNAKFEALYQALLRVEGVLDARLKHLEEREH